MGHLFIDGVVRPESGKKHTFSENYATMPSRIEIGFQNRNPGVFSLCKEALKTIF